MKEVFLGGGGGGGEPRWDQFTADSASRAPFRRSSPKMS